MSKHRVLFICQHNSARSQMAQAYLNDLGGDRFEAHSAGLEPSTVNPLAVQAMKDDGYDIADATTQSVFDLFKEGELFEYVITVCDPEVEAKCPLFPGVTERMHWPFPDPAALTGTLDEKLAGTREIRDAIKQRITEFLADY